jgi:RNA polymerase sigma-70 factor (ECF subfamily)
VLGWSASEVAALLDTTVTAVNSALQRARATIEAEAPAHRVAPGRGRQRELLDRYVDAWDRADMNALLELLREDAVMTMPPQAAIVGAEAIVAFLAEKCPFYVATIGWVNRAPAIDLRHRDGSPHRLLVLDVGDERVDGIAVYTRE